MFESERSGNAVAIDANATSLIDEIRNRNGVFSHGIVTAPLERICLIAAKQLAIGNVYRFQISTGALRLALKEADWIDRGRVSSANYNSARHVFCAPELRKIRKSRLREMVEDLDFKNIALQAVADYRINEEDFEDSSSLVSDGYMRLISLIRSCQGPFGDGIAVSPFQNLIIEINSFPELDKFSNFVITRKSLEVALIEGGWTSRGAIASVKNHTRRRIFCSPHLMDFNNSQLRDLAEDLEIEKRDQNAHKLKDTKASINTKISDIVSATYPDLVVQAEDLVEKLLPLIQTRAYPFHTGLVVTPLGNVLTQLNSRSEFSTFSQPIIKKDILIIALLEAGWVELLVASAKFPSRRRLYRAPELSHLNKSQLRDLVEEISVEPE